MRFILYIMYSVVVARSLYLCVCVHALLVRQMATSSVDVVTKMYLRKTAFGLVHRL